MAKHTKGPWEADGISVRSEGSDGRQIALCEITVRGRPYNETYDEAIANAHLIASAPVLLDALKRIASIMDFNGTGHPLFKGMQKQMTDAIAKAEGR